MNAYMFGSSALVVVVNHFFLLPKGSDAADGCHVTKLGSNRKLLLFVVVVFEIFVFFFFVVRRSAKVAG